MKTTITCLITTLSINVVYTAQAVEIKKEKPNIIWLMAEDISLDLGCYGMEGVKTPNLDRMAHEGVRFDNCFVTNPISSPSRSAMMTGTHQVKINAANHRSNRNVALDTSFKPFTYWLREAGYTCVLGNELVMRRGRKVDCNFKTTNLGEWDGIENFGLFDKYDVFEAVDQPFFAQIQLVATHRGDWWDDVRAQSSHPVNPDSIVLPPYMADHPVIRLDWAKYLDQMEYIDNEVGIIFQLLEEKGVADNTIVIFIGDNGRCNLRGKGYLNDPGLHIPLIIYCPEKLNAGTIRKDVVSAVDITATILDFAGIDTPDYMTGKPIFSNNFQREYAYGARDVWDEIDDKSRSISSDEWKYIRNDKPWIPWDAGQAYLEFYRPALHVMRTLKSLGQLSENEKLFFQEYKPFEELYNLVNDPNELNNLADDPSYKPILKKMREATLRYDEEMKPANCIYESIHPRSVDLLKWVIEEQPDLHQEMMSGVEIGFQTLMKKRNSDRK